MLNDFAINYNKNIWITFTQPLVNTTSLSTSYANSDYLTEWFGTPANEMYKYYKPSLISYLLWSTLLFDWRGPLRWR